MDFFTSIFWAGLAFLLHYVSREHHNLFSALGFCILDPSLIKHVTRVK